MAALRCQLEDSATHGNTDDDAMYHLQVAQTTLNERYSKLQKKNAELQKRYDQMIVKLVLFFIACQYTDEHFCYSNFVCLSVRPSVCCVPVFYGNGLTYCNSFSLHRSPIILVL